MIARLGKTLGVMAYACAAYLLWKLTTGRLEIDQIGPVLAVTMLISLSFGAWLAGPHTQSLSARISHGFAIATLAAALIILGRTMPRLRANVSSAVPIDTLAQRARAGGRDEASLYNRTLFVRY